MAYKMCEYFSEQFMECLAGYVSKMSNRRTSIEHWNAVGILCDYVKKDFLDIDDRDVSNFFNYMATRVHNGGLSAATFNNRKSIYNKVSCYLIDTYPELNFINHFSLVLSIGGCVQSIKASSIPSLKELDAILEASKSRPMYYLIISLAFRVALPTSDILSLRLEHIHKEGDKLFLFIPQKGSRESRLIDLPEDISNLLMEYVSTMSYVDSYGHLFYSQRLTPLSQRSLDWAVSEFVKTSGINSKYTMRDLRSRSILDMVRAAGSNDVSPVSVANYVGIRDLRLNTYVNASMVIDNCPATLVNLSVNGVSKTDFEPELKNSEMAGVPYA